MPLTKRKDLSLTAQWVINPMISICCCVSVASRRRDNNHLESQTLSSRHLFEETRANMKMSRISGILTELICQLRVRSK